MKTCPHCYTELPDGATVCRSCGAIERTLSSFAKFKDIALVMLAAALVLAAVLFVVLVPRFGMFLYDILWYCVPALLLCSAQVFGMDPLTRLRQNYYGQKVWTRP